MVFLNSELMQGHNLMMSILAVLLKFHQEHVAVIEEMKKMFYKISMPKKHRDYLILFGYNNDDPKEEPVRFHLKVHIFGGVTPHDYELRPSTYSIWRDLQWRSEELHHKLFLCGWLAEIWRPFPEQTTW